MPNLNTISEGWPIPNIKHVLERISRSKVKYFAVLDLQGYYQMEIDEISRYLTASRTVNPEKVIIHFTEVEYVGHVIDKYGISFSDEKRSKVTEFRLPAQARDMKKFSGLISQFRDHVPNFSILTVMKRTE